VTGRDQLSTHLVLTAAAKAGKLVLLGKFLELLLTPPSEDFGPGLEEFVDVQSWEKRVDSDLKSEKHM